MNIVYYIIIIIYIDVYVYLYVCVRVCVCVCTYVCGGVCRGVYICIKCKPLCMDRCIHYHSLLSVWVHTKRAGMGVVLPECMIIP